MLHDAPTAAIVSAIVRMAEPMQLDVVAEGVETDEQLVHLSHLGCQYAQGFLFSRPLEAADAERLLSGDIDGDLAAA
jgi:EAL domain-containing protein (putative c-di-GMP-specific phosphodiesterase class I)